MELHSRVYYKHPDSTIMGQLEVLFTTHHGDEEKFIQTALLVNPQADEITQELVDLIDSIEHDPPVFAGSKLVVRTVITFLESIVCTVAIALPA